MIEEINGGKSNLLYRKIPSNLCSYYALIPKITLHSLNVPSFQGGQCGKGDKRITSRWKKLTTMTSAR